MFYKEPTLPTIHQRTIVDRWQLRPRFLDIIIRSGFAGTSMRPQNLYTPTIDLESPLSDTIRDSYRSRSHRRKGVDRDHHSRGRNADRHFRAYDSLL